MNRIIKLLWIFIFLASSPILAQKQNNLVQKEIIILKDTIKLENNSITPFHFLITNDFNKKIDTSKYTVLFKKGILILKDTSLFRQKIHIQYQKYPDFLTKTYRALDTSLIVKNTKSNFRLYHSKILDKKEKYNVFKGLETKGNIVRGMRFGNNQDAVLDANLELRIQGNLSEKVKIRANIIDSNIPVQNNGYTQRLDEYDKIFIEIFTKKWQVIAGDLPFKSDSLKYLHFQKKVQGLSVKSTFGDSIKNTNFYVSGAVVRGKFTSVNFKGQNGNQGPYNIINQENAYWLIVANSERVYVNGLQLKRGKDKDYTIDYNTAEIYFNPTYPINSNMRITVEFQISDQNYTRFVSFNEIHRFTEKSKIQLSIYNENDLKNSGINQNLTQNQLEILANAGDEISQMVVPSAVPEDYDIDKIQYKKENQNGEDIFVFSNDPNEQLYHVNFTYVGKNNGNYTIDEVLANGKVFKYVAPSGNEKQGDYEPIIRLTAPNKLQLLNLKTAFTPNKKTKIASELSYSYFDKNLFSNKQDNDNNGFAGNVFLNKILIDKKWQVSTLFYDEFVSENFKTVERFQNIEFNREWNLTNVLNQKQNLFNIGFLIKKDSVSSIKYNFKNLDIKSNFKGNKHELQWTNRFKKWQFESQSSLLNTSAISETTQYITSINRLKYQLKNKWIGSEYTIENNQRKDKMNGEFTPLSFKNTTFKSYIGFGDKKKIFSEIGYQFRKNDSISNNKFSTFEKANSIFLNSKFIQNKKTDLSLFANYEITESRVTNQSKFLNTQLKYRQQLFKNIINFNLNYQTGSGNLPQQDYQFIEVEPGHGYYQWIDYNNDNIKDLDEFEVAVFQDQANYLKIALPTINYLPINTNKFNGSLAINLSSLTKNKLLSHFSNQTSIVSDVKRKRDQVFIHLNPFDYNKQQVLSLKTNFKNSLFYNRGKQHFSTTYSYLKAQNKAVFITGFQENKIRQHLLKLVHLLKKQWLFDFGLVNGKNKSDFETFSQRNFDIDKNQFTTKIKYLKSKFLKLGMQFQFKKMKNQLENQEQLTANQYGTSIEYSKNEKASLRANFNWIDNRFNGNPLSAVGYQMLEGLQNGKNYTWQVIMQKSINSFLQLNLSYQGRKSVTSKTIHIGSVQLRAVF